MSKFLNTILLTIILFCSGTLIVGINLLKNERDLDPFSFQITKNNEYSDFFSSPSLDPKWSWNPDSGNLSAYSLTNNPGYLNISCPQLTVSWQNGVYDVPYICQDLPTGNWEIEILVNEPAANEHANGIILYKDISNWVMYANHYDSVGEMNLLRGNLSGTADTFAGGGRDYNQPYLKLVKKGVNYSCYSSPDGITWYYNGSMVTSILFDEMGVWGQSRAMGPFNSNFEYFKFTIIPDESPPGLTLEEIALIIGIIVGIITAIGVVVGLFRRGAKKDSK